ncbi:Dymeclin [Phytophthora cinnamomi]|uniref:Dymeclin n=1 Tax=Phytophthora cinnamomi TaxID=4785 RepID=UPI00355A338D|nr:Dymeclin [Phytophthora cinnamomi]
MGASTSSPATAAAVEQIFASAQERAAFEKIVGETPVPRGDAAYHAVLAGPKPLPQLSQAQVELLTREYGETLAQSSLQSGNFRVLLRYVIHALPFSCKTVDTHVLRAVNALFLVRQFTMRFVERTDECSLLAHFNHQPTTEFAGTSNHSDATTRHSLSIQMDEVGGKDMNDASAPEYFSDDLALRFLDTLLTALIEFPPNEKTHDLHVEVVNTLLVLLSPVAYPRDHSKQAGDLRAHNPFLYMLMSAALPDGKKSYWASGVVRRLLQNSIEQLQASGPNAASNTAVVALRKVRDMSLIAMSGISDQAYEQEQFSYFTLEGVGSIAASIFRFPWSFIRYFTTHLFEVVGHHAPYEASHLMLYTLLYSNPMIRLYMLVIVLLTFTQDPEFVRTAHTQLVMPNVSWYQEHYMLDVSLGSLMMVIFTRLIFRNITHFQDSFIHLNAFAALSNLARSAENLHVYAAQGVVGLIDMLAKNEAKLVTQMKRLKSSDKEENEVLAQKRSAYVEFIRLLLGVVSSCLKAKLLPRNPQLIYSLLHRAGTFAALQQHSEFAAQVNNGPVWSTLARFQAVVDAKTSPDDVLDTDTVLEIIRCECVSLVAASSASSRTGGASRSKASVNDDDASYRYEEEADPEQFFVPYIWKLIQEQTPDFCWKEDKITLFVPSGIAAPTSVATSS